GNAEAWCDWVLRQGGETESWQRGLDPTVEAFAHDIGRLKDQLRQTHGNAAERFVRRAGEVADQAGFGGFVPDRLRSGRDAERGGAGPDAGGGPASQRSVAYAGPGPRGPGPHSTGQGGTGRAAGGGAAPQPGVAHAGPGPGGPGQPSTGQGKVSTGRPDARPGGAASAGADRRHADPAVVRQIEAQIQLATPLVDTAAELSRW